jgi:peptidoglycan biosynthesis protein MviN/MurJ (putative lipid II flippase)
VPTAIAAINLVITAGAAFALYEPFGVGGIVAATAIATAASVAAQGVVLRGMLGGLEIPKLIFSTIRIAIASLALAGVSYGVWDALDHLLGGGLAAGAAVYVGALALLRVPELEQILRLARRGESGRGGSGDPPTA